MYDVLSHIGSEVATVNGGNGAQSSLDYTPYGQVLSGTNSDGFVFTGLQRDPDGIDHADMRQYTSTAGRWITSDPYSGSYDIENPQSLNRYAYVNNNPLGFVDPTGLSAGGELCSAIPVFFLSAGSSKTPQIITVLGDGTKLAGYGKQQAKGSCSDTLISLGQFLGKQLLAYGADTLFPLHDSKGNPDSVYNGTQDYYAAVQALITIGCSIDYNSTACGPPQLASLIPGAGGDVGKAVGDGLAVGYAVCAIGEFTNPACDAFALYQIANSVYGLLYSIFGWGPPKFAGSLLPRPGTRGGLGSSLVGIPNQGAVQGNSLGHF